MGRHNSLSGDDPRFTTHLSPHIYQARKRATQTMGMLGHLLNRKSDFSTRNGVLLYKQFIRPMMDYACPVWRSVARTHVRRLQMLQSRVFALLLVPLGTYVTGRYTKFWVFRCLPTTSRALTVGFGSKLDDVGNPLVRQLGRYLR